MKLTRIKLLGLMILLSTCAAYARTATRVEHGSTTGRPSLAPSSVFPGLGTGAIADSPGPGAGNWGPPLNVTFDVTNVVGPIRHVVLSITMTHTYVGDLDVVLTAPNGQTSLVIFSRIGAATAQSFGDSSNLAGTYTFADYALPNPWTVATHPACEDTCIITPQAYRTTLAGPQTGGFITSLDNAFSPLAFPNGTWTLRFRDGTNMDTGFVTSASLTIETFYSRIPFDFDGDDRTDIGIFRPGPAEWWINRSSNGSTFAAQFGTQTDVITPADFTGDGRTDIAFWRPSNGFWFVLRSEDFSFYALPFGSAGDIPVPADYDGDGREDVAVFRPSSSTWYIQRPSGATIVQPFGSPGDVPAVGDYDVDGLADIGIFRASTGQWWIKRSSSIVFVTQFGASGDKPVQGDYTGDGKTDIAVWRPSNGNWYVLRSENMSFYSLPFGVSTDIPAPGDYDGDRKYDPTVFRPSSSTWFSNRSAAGIQIVQFGSNGDRPIPNAYVP